VRVDIREGRLDFEVAEDEATPERETEEQPVAG
jgi:hypothetical protein